MDITSYIIDKRHRAFLLGDHAAYKSQLARQIHTLRRKLKVATPKNAKYSAKAPLTAEVVAKNKDFVYLQLLLADRAWAHAMQMKANHTDELNGATRKHVVSRLNRAYGYAMELLGSLKDKAVSGATTMDVLEAQAYASSMMGAQEFEKHASQRYEDAQAANAAWKKCLTAFSEAHIVYTAVAHVTQRDYLQDVLANPVDPSIRYAAYQARLPRSLAINAVAKDYFPKDKIGLVSDIEEIFPSAFSNEQATQVATSDGTVTADIPTTVTWRSRTAPIADSAIGQAMAATSLATTQLSSLFTSQSNKTPKALAASYDPVLTAARDAVEATDSALTELIQRADYSESDANIQNLRVTNLYLNYTHISWRIGRNRVLISSSAGGSTFDDGLKFEPAAPSVPKRPRKDGTPLPSKPESKGGKLARLRQRVVLYGAILQSITTISELSGASRDEDFINELAAQRAYFQALRALNIGYSHAVVGNAANALALFARSVELLGTASPLSSSKAIAPGSPPTLDVSSSSYETARSHCQALMAQYRGLVALHSSYSSAGSGATAYNSASDPLVAKLDSYPPPGATIDLHNLVNYPPKLVPVPVKPIFLDLAWNYIEYPGQQQEKVQRSAPTGVVESVVEKVQDVVIEGAAEGTNEAKKRGWFGFGRK